MQVEIMTDERAVAVHPAPVWRDRADFILAAALPEAGRSEQLWARRVGGRRFEICCIPFFLYDIALGDVVETDENRGVLAVVEASGRYVFRVWFGESFHPRREIEEQLVTIGALVEWSSTNLLAVDASDTAHAKVVADLLAEQELAGKLRYETGRS